MSHHDWETVTLKKIHAQKTRGMSQAQAITMGKRDGVIETQKRFIVPLRAFLCLPMVLICSWSANWGLFVVASGRTGCGLIGQL